MLTIQEKKKICEAVRSAIVRYESQNKLGLFLGVSRSTVRRLEQEEFQSLTDEILLRVARKLDVTLRDRMEWKGARTATFDYVTTQLEACQERSLSVILCDIPNIGKTFTARRYATEHRNAVYVDCSQTKTKRAMVRAIANGFGVGLTGKYQDCYEDLIYCLRSMDRPLVILDEAGDLQYEAFLELKALWNATEMQCGWYMMGADGLSAKINRNVDGRKVGYAEIFSRYGGKYSRVTPEQEDDRRKFLLEQARVVAKVNAPEGTDIGQIVRKSQGGLRRVYTEIEKLKKGAS